MIGHRGVVLSGGLADRGTPGVKVCQWDKQYPEDGMMGG